VVLRVHNELLLHNLGLHGFIHLWGAAGSGKTLLSSLIAADASRHGFVEWINTDSKRAFVGLLKTNVQTLNGRMENIKVTMTNGSREAIDAVTRLPEIAEDGTVLCVIDSITRTLDMGREDPLLWGREFIEKVFPTLASFASVKSINVLVTSECRQIPGLGTVPVLHRTIAKWADHEIQVKRAGPKSRMNIIHSRYGEDEEFRIATICPLQDGSLVIADTHPVPVSGEV